MARPPWLGGRARFRLELGISGGSSDGSLWDTGLWDEATWAGDGDTPGGVTWYEIDRWAEAVETNRGRDLFFRRMRTGTLRAALADELGFWNPISGPLPPLGLRLRPGRMIRLSCWVSGVDPGSAQVVRIGPGGSLSCDAVIDSARFEVSIDHASEPGADQRQQIVSTATGPGPWAIDLEADSALQVIEALLAGGPGPTRPAAAGLRHLAKLESFVGQASPSQVQLTVDGQSSAVFESQFDGTTEGTPVTFGPDSDGTLRIWGSLIEVDGSPVAVLDPREFDPAGWTDQAGATWTVTGDVTLEDGPAAQVFETWVPLWTGYVDTLAEQYGRGGYGGTMRIEATDLMAILQRDDPPALEIPVPQELSSARVDRILEEAGWPAEYRNTDPGLFEVQSSELAQTRLEELQRAADAEGSAFFIGPDGFTEYRQNGWLQNYPRSTEVQAYIGQEAEDALPILRAVPVWSGQVILNDIQLARRGGTMRRYTDTASWSLYGVRTYRRLDLENANDTDLDTLGNDLLLTQRYDRLRLQEVTVQPILPIHLATLIGLEIGDLVEVQVRPQGGTWAYTIRAHIQGIRWQISASDVTATLRLDDSFTGSPEDAAAFSDGFDDGFL